MNINFLDYKYLIHLFMQIFIKFLASLITWYKMTPPNII